MHHTVIEAYRRSFVLTVLEAAKTVRTSVRPDGVSERLGTDGKVEGAMPDGGGKSVGPDTAQAEIQYRRADCRRN